MAITPIANGIARGGTISSPDPAQTSVMIDSRGADFLFAAFAANAQQGTQNPLSDTLGNVWTRLVALTGDYSTQDNTCAFYYLTNPITSATHTCNVVTGNPGQQHGTLDVSAWAGVDQTTPFNAQQWLATNPLTLGPLAILAGLVFSVATVPGATDTPSGTGLPTLSTSGWTLLDVLAATAGSGGTAGLSVQYQLAAAGAVSAAWSADMGNPLGAGIFAFTAAAPTPPPATTTYPIRRLRRFMLPWDDANRMKFLSRLELVMQTGIGTTTTTSPTVMLRLSKDGGMTWGNEIQMNAGAMGAFFTRVFANRLGRARNWVAEVSVSDGVDWQWLQCLVDYEEGTS